MKCPNCGAEIPNNAKFCEFCDSQITVDMKEEQEKLNKTGCPKCGSSNISFSREKLGEVKGKKSTSVIRSTVGMCKDCGYTWTTSESQKAKPRKTWLWVLGWIYIFPVPLTILMLRKKDMKAAIKYTIIAVAWIIYLLIGVGLNNANTSTNPSADTSPKVSITDTENTNTAKDTNISDSNIAETELEISIEPNVNSDDGSVLFGVTANLPEDTKLTVTLTNANGYNESDTVTILKNGTGYTSEFEENGSGLNGDYEVTVTDTDGKVLSVESFTFSFKNAA